MILSWGCLYKPNVSEVVRIFWNILTKCYCVHAMQCWIFCINMAVNCVIYFAGSVQVEFKFK